jgi:transketolase
MAKPDTKWLKKRANELRISILNMAVRANGGHIGGAYSIIDVMTALYFRVLKHDPSNPAWPERDRVIYSKGHGSLALYNVLAGTGYFGEERLQKFSVDGGLLAGHPERDFVPGVEATTGSLGHGLSIGCGMALADQLDKNTRRVFVIMSDGECNEGSIWEAAMSASQFKLDNLTLVIDSNKLESLGKVSDIMNIEPLGERFRTFGWGVVEIDGHDMELVVEALERAPFEASKPSLIVAHTVKGKGVSFMENVPMWHFRAPNEKETKMALAELEGALQ